jgi:hypothetical protein
MGRLSHWVTEHAIGLCIIGSLTFWAGLVATALALPVL